jgi:hypothetical protein
VLARVHPQAIDVQDVDASVADVKQARFLQLVQGAMGDLAGNSGQPANLLLRNMQDWMGLGVELRIEEFS